MDTKGTDEKLGKLQEFEAGFLSKHFSDALTTADEVRRFLDRSRDSIFITAIFLKLAGIFGTAPHATRMLIVKIMGECGHLFFCAANKDEIMKLLLRPLTSNSPGQRTDSHLMAQTLGPYYHNKFAVLHEIIDALRRADSRAELSVGNSAVLSLCRRSGEFADTILDGIEKLVYDRTIPRCTRVVIVETLSEVTGVSK